MAQYVVMFAGDIYGPFATNNAVVNAANTDAEYWANHNTPGAPIHLLKPITAFALPFPASQASG